MSICLFSGIPNVSMPLLGCSKDGIPTDGNKECYILTLKINL